MERADLTELHYVCHVNNLRSILAHGILSHRRAQRREPASIASEDVQARRASKAVPGGQPLHSYVNLYLNARNPMLYRVTNGGRDAAHICILSISTAVLDIDGVVLADGNAAAVATAFRPGPSGLAAVARDRTFARYWTHPGDPAGEAEHKRVMCAEVLVPSVVNAEMVGSVYVADSDVAATLAEVVPNARATPREYLFFR